MAAGTTPKATFVKLYSARPAPEAHHTGNARNLLPKFCKSLRVGDNIIVWVCNAERAINPDENDSVAKVENFALQLDKGEVYSHKVQK